FADFQPEGGPDTTLAADIHAAGTFVPSDTASPQWTSTVDGYQVSLAGHMDAGKVATVTATITRDGVPVTDLQPYLGAYGHLVALRASDLDYLHVHPYDGPAGPDIKFGVEVPTAGRYRLFLDFQHGGRV